jgi:hypothetical protein
MAEQRIKRGGRAARMAKRAAKRGRSIPVHPASRGGPIAAERGRSARIYDTALRPCWRSLAWARCRPACTRDLLAAGAPTTAQGGC